jgi:hypothetical protein
MIDSVNLFALFRYHILPYKLMMPITKQYVAHMR